MYLTRVAQSAVAAVVYLGVMTACSQTDSTNSSGEPSATPSATHSAKDYCALIKQFKAADTPDGDIHALLAKARTIREAAPKAQQAEWDTLNAYMQKLYDAGDDQAKAAKVVADSAAARKAGEALAKHAKETCGVDIPTK